MSKFKAGDTVICHDVSGIEGLLHLNCVYEVERPFGSGLVLIKNKGEFFESRFAPYPAVGALRMKDADILSISVSAGKPLVTIHPDGTITYGPDYTPDAAAKVFWESMASLAPVKLLKDARAELEGVDQALNNYNVEAILDCPGGRVGRIRKLARLYRECRQSLEGARDAARVLRSEVEALRNRKEVNPLYVRELEEFRQNCAKETAGVRGENEGILSAFTRVLGEYKRMKRQLELAESYNFERKDLTEAQVSFDLYNYVLLGLGKAKLTWVEWCVKKAAAVIGRSMKEAFARGGVSMAHGSLNYTLPAPLSYIPISFTTTTEKPVHQGDAYSPTGCGQDCSHPDCKDHK